LPDHQLDLGRQLARERVLHRAVRQHAYRAVSAAPEGAVPAMISDTELYRMADHRWRSATLRDRRFSRSARPPGSRHPEWSPA
jgi:hypothetical protein